MEDLDLKLDSIANGVLVQQTDKKKADADEKKRMYASAFAYIRSQTGMNKKDFAEYLGIPYRTLQDWELGNTQAPEYVLRLIAYKVQMEKGQCQVIYEKMSQNKKARLNLENCRYFSQRQVSATLDSTQKNCCR